MFENLCYKIMYLFIYYFTKLQLLLFVRKLPELSTEIVGDAIIVSRHRNKRVIFEDTSTKESHAKFIYAEIVTAEGRKEVHFKTDQYNYFIVGNVFDEQFIRFFMNRHYGVELDEYCINFIDNDMNDCVVTSDQSIKFLDYGYEISKTT